MKYIIAIILYFLLYRLISRTITSIRNAKESRRPKVDKRNEEKSSEYFIDPRDIVEVDYTEVYDNDEDEDDEVTGK